MSEPIAEKPYTVPKSECPRCKQVIEQAQDVTPGASNTLKKGKILVCSKCAMITLVGDGGLVPMSVNQIRSLPKLLQAQLMAVCQKVAQRVTSGQN